jgi:uncharacterized protein involved in exopolysaccharide biosynthesis
MAMQKTMINDEISLADLLSGAIDLVKQTWRERALVVFLTGICTGIGVLIALNKPNQYSATTSILAGNSGKSSQTLTSIAGFAGIPLPAGSSDLGVSTNLYPKIAGSFDFRRVIAETPVYFESYKRRMSLIEYTEIHDKDKKWSESITSFKRKNAEKGTPSKKAVTNNITSEGLNPLKIEPRTFSIIVQVSDYVKVSIDNKTGLITVTSWMPDAYAAADLAQMSARSLIKQISKIELSRAQEQLRFVEKQHEEAKARYEGNQRKWAEYKDRNRLLNSETSQIEGERLKEEFELAFEIYQQLSRELEQAKLRRSQDTPTFVILEPAIVPNDKESPNRTKIVLTFAIIGILTSMVFVAMKGRVRPTALY